MSKKERIIPKLDDNFHESIFFLEIKFSKTPTKEIKEKLIDYYIKGVDYYTSTNQKDFSLYFQTKLLNIMKDVDTFEKIVENKLVDEKEQKEKINLLLNKAKDMDTKPKYTINNEIQKQQDQFLFNLAQKKKQKKFKRFNSLKISNNTKNRLTFRSRKESVKLEKKGSMDISGFRNNLNNSNKTNNNPIFSKIDNALVDFDKINTLIIIEYSKKLRQFAKMKMEITDKKTDKYLNYIRTNNELNLLYEDLPDKTGDEAENMKTQINLNREEWELYDKNEEKQEVEKENNLRQKINEKNIADKILDKVIMKINELIKDNENHL